MFIAGLILAGIAAAVHVFIFYLESVAWESQRARDLFLTGTVNDAKATRFVAYNQGFYNLFLAIQVVLGVVFIFVGAHQIGLTLIIAAVASMLAAAVILFVSSKPHRSAAIKQGSFPLLALIALVASILL